MAKLDRFIEHGCIIFCDLLLLTICKYQLKIIINCKKRKSDNLVNTCVLILYIGGCISCLCLTIRAIDPFSYLELYDQSVINILSQLQLLILIITISEALMCFLTNFAISPIIYSTKCYWVCLRIFYILSCIVFFVLELNITGINKSLANIIFQIIIITYEISFVITYLWVAHNIANIMNDFIIYKYEYQIVVSCIKYTSYNILSVVFFICIFQLYQINIGFDKVDKFILYFQFIVTFNILYFAWISKNPQNIHYIISKLLLKQHTPSSTKLQLVIQELTPSTERSISDLKTIAHQYDKMNANDVLTYINNTPDQLSNLDIQ